MQNEKARIAFFHLAFLYSGGGEKLALKEVEYLRKQGHKVDCFAPLVNKEECFPDLIQIINPQEIIKGCTKFFHNKPELGVIVTCILFPFIARKFKNYTIVIGANQPSAYFGFILKILFKIPYMAYIAQPTRMIYPRHIDKEVGFKLKNKITFLPIIINVCRPIFFWIDLKSITCADKFLCNGPYMQVILTNIYGIKPISCPPGAYFKPLTQNTNKQKNGQPYILVTNRHFPHKKFEVIIENLAIMKNKMHVIITGEHTDYTQQLKKLVAWYQLEEYVTFKGLVSEQELDYLYKHCAMYIYTAPEEDFGMGVIEAMGYAKPVIAYNNAGPSYTIKHKYNGLLVDLDKPYQFARYIEFLQNNPTTAKTIGINAYNTVREKYGWSNHIAIMKQHLNEMLLTTQNNEVKLSYINTIASNSCID